MQKYNYNEGIEGLENQIERVRMEIKEKVRELKYYEDLKREWRKDIKKYKEKDIKKEKDVPVYQWWTKEKRHPKPQRDQWWWKTRTI